MLWIIGELPVLRRYLAADPSLDRTPEGYQWGRWPLNMQVLVPDMAMAAWAPYSKSRLRLGCVGGSCVVRGRFESTCLEVYAWLLDDRPRISRRCAQRRLFDSRLLGRLDRCRVGQQFRNLRWMVNTHPHMLRTELGGRGPRVCLSVCVRICASAQTEKPLAPGGVHTQ